ncbi:surface-adhesin E family protein [Phenylobacterium sp.]|jgi:hypothetical protein|uniref:surface-adhesin E family protein n=1 Tax=Phenylobacterium sp. TaxID=1871053 RepID=UPI002F419DC2
MVPAAHIRRNAACAASGLASALLAAAGAAHATNFDVIRADADAVVFLDPQAVETVPGAGKLRRAQIVRVQRSILSEGPRQPGYVSTLTDYDCDQWKYRWRSFSVYSRSGQRLLHKDNDDPVWSAVAKDVDARPAARRICDGQATLSTYAASSIGQLVSALMQAWDEAEPLPPGPGAAPAATPAPPQPAKKRRKPAP